MTDQIKELERKILAKDTWDMNLLQELCCLAGLEQEWDESDGENFEAVAIKAAKKLGIEII